MESYQFLNLLSCQILITALLNVLHFCSQASTNKMEKIQERALRFICNEFTSNVEPLLLLNNAAPFHIGRMKLMASEGFKYYIICHHPT